MDTNFSRFELNKEDLYFLKELELLHKKPIKMLKQKKIPSKPLKNYKKAIKNLNPLITPPEILYQILLYIENNRKISKNESYVGMRTFLATDRYGLPRKNESIGFKSKHGHITDLYLTNIPRIPESIGNLRNLKFLKISISNLKNLPESLFNLDNLEELDLRNFHSDIPENIGLLSSLEKLSLGGSFKKIPDLIGRLKNLRVLNFLGTENLTSLPDSIGDLIKLEELRFLADSNCQSAMMMNIPIQFLPSSIKGLKNLKVLNLSGCRTLERIPEEIGELSSLEILDLGEYNKDLMSMGSDNSFISTLKKWKDKRIFFGKTEFALPDNIGKLENLKSLRLSFWKNLKHLPKSIGNLNSLEKLDLRFCSSLEYLPETIGRLEKLSFLDLKCCKKLESLPESIGNLQNLKNLNLEGCKKLSNLPESIIYLENLSSLNIRNCNFEEFPINFPHLKDSQWIDLTGNPLKSNYNEYSSRISKKLVDNLSLNPIKVFKDHSKNIINEEEALKRLTFIFNESGSDFIKTMSVEILHSLKIKNEKAFFFLKHIIENQENHPCILASSLRTLIENFTDKAFDICLELVENVQYLLVFAVLYRNLFKFREKKANKLKTRLNVQYAKELGILPEEAPFIIDMDLMRVMERSVKLSHLCQINHLKIGYDLYGCEWKELKTLYSNIEEALRCYGESHCSYVLINKHIIGISPHVWKINTIPKSIKLLKKLMYLPVQFENQIPPSMRSKIKFF